MFTCTVLLCNQLPVLQTLYKAGKVLAQRGLEKCAENCEVIRSEVEGFKKFVPLVQVGAAVTISVLKDYQWYGSIGAWGGIGPSNRAWHGLAAHTDTAMLFFLALALQALRNPGVRERHWDQLSGSLGFRLHPDKTFTLHKAEDMGLLSHLDIITKVCTTAS